MKPAPRPGFTTKPTSPAPAAPVARNHSLPVKTLNVVEGKEGQLTRLTGLFEKKDKRGLPFYSGTDKASEVTYFLMANTKKGTNEVTGYTLRYKNEAGEYVDIGKTDGKVSTAKNGSNYQTVKVGDATYFIYDNVEKVA